jgi:hypothetical protein
MANRQNDAVNKELHPQAEKLAREYIMDFATSLLLQAKLLSYKRNADVVLSNHIEEALQIVNRQQKSTWSREVILVIGSALFGAFIQGFVSELSTGNTLLIVIYTVLGFIGMLLVFWGLQV